MEGRLACYVSIWIVISTEKKTWKKWELFLVVVVGTLLTALLTPTNANNNEGEIQKLTEIVQLNGGQVQGVVRETNNGNKVNFFQGIRFGQAKRFCKSTPVEPWTEIYDATQMKAVCPQPGFGVPMMPGSNEDCLYLNIWQPAEPKKTLRSVMVWIHGGGFFGGSINIYEAIRLAELGDVVVVAINYRLGPLGFLTFGSEEEPGNLGLHDQILGLKWVQENIDRFGGNPDDVTIFGESAGAMSVGALILSPLTSGLFHRAILQSGAPNIEQVCESKQKSLQKTSEFAKRMDCFEADIESAIKCLREKPIDKLVETGMADFYQLNSFLPIYGDDLLPMSPTELLEQPLNRNLDLMFGVTRDEGTMFVTPMFPKIDMDKLTPKSAKKAMKLMLEQLRIPNSKSVLKHYSKGLNEKMSLDELKLAVSDLLGDYLLTCPTILFGQKLVRSLAGNNHHNYAYRMMTPVNLTFPKEMESSFPKWLGISHGTDLAFLFDVLFLNVTKSSDQFELVSKHMIEAWTEFAKTGQISPISGVEWTEALDPSQPQSSSAKYFSIDPTDYKMVQNYWSETCEQIWEPILVEMQTAQTKPAKTEL